MKIIYSNVFALFVSYVFISCSDNPPPYYVVDKIRTPTAQIYSQTSQTGQGCIAGLFDSNTWCQQFPIRPTGTMNAAGAGKVKLRFSILAPSGNTVTLTLTSLKMFDIGLFNGSTGNGARGADPSTPAVEIPLTDFSFNLNTILSTTVQTSPMQMQTIVFDLTPPSLNALIAYAQSINKFPGFILTYASSSPTQSYVDNGYLTFFLLPDPADTSSWTTLTSSVSSFVNNSVLAQALTLSKLNIPIQITSGSISPSSGSIIAASSSNYISAQLTYNPNPYSFSPVQWYVSSGAVDNDRNISTTWNPNQNGTVSSFFVVRDLLGGMDYSLNNYTAQ